MKLNFILKTSKNSIIIFKWLLYFLQVCKSVPGANLISSPAWGGVITDSVKTQTYKKSNQSKVFISIVRLNKNIKTYKDPSFINGFHIQTEWICLDCLTWSHVDKSQPAISRCLCLEAENVRQVHINKNVIKWHSAANYIFISELTRDISSHRFHSDDWMSSRMILGKFLKLHCVSPVLRLHWGWLLSNSEPGIL